MSYTQEHKKEILKAADFLKEQNFREETNFSLYATAEQMVRWHEKQAKEIAQKFAEWVEKLSPSQRVSVWSKDGSCSGIFSMDYEQLFDKFKKVQ